MYMIGYWFSLVDELFMSFHLAPNLSFDIAIGAGVLGVACALFCCEA